MGRKLAISLRKGSNGRVPNPDATLELHGKLKINLDLHCVGEKSPPPPRPAWTFSVRKQDTRTRGDLSKALYFCRRVQVLPVGEEQAREQALGKKEEGKNPIFIPVAGGTSVPFPLVRSGLTFFSVG